MDKAKRARTAETPKQPSLGLKLRAPYIYPDQLDSGWRRSTLSVSDSPSFNLLPQLRHGGRGLLHLPAQLRARSLTRS
jgi:hypothetical protein